MLLLLYCCVRISRCHDVCPSVCLCSTNMSKALRVLNTSSCCQALVLSPVPSQKQTNRKSRSPIGPPPQPPKFQNSIGSWGLGHSNAVKLYNPNGLHRLPKSLVFQKIVNWREKVVRVNTGGELRYDKLCICNGGYPRVTTRDNLRVLGISNTL